MIKIVSVPHTPYLCCLTATSVHLLEQHALLPITYHRRHAESLQQFGANIDIKVKFQRVKSAQLEKIKYTNIMVLTDKKCIKIYQIVLSHSKSHDGIFEVDFADSSDMLQNGLPLVSSSNSLGILDYVKQATKLLMGGGNHVPVENLEHFNNSSIDDEINNYDIDKVRISPFKMFRLTIDIDDYWLKPNSNNLIIYNARVAKVGEQNGQEDNHNSNGLDTPKRMHYIFETVNLKTSHAVTIPLKDCFTYPFHENTRLHHVTYDLVRDQFLILNEKNELWTLNYDDAQTTFNTKLAYHIADHKNPKVISALNPKYGLLLLAIDNEIRLLERTKEGTFVLLKKFTLKVIPRSIVWSPNGEFFITIGQQYFRIFSKFGSCTFSSSYMKKESDQVYGRRNEFSDWLTPESVIVSDNSFCLYVQTKEKLALVNLCAAISKCDLFINSRYISLINSTSRFIHFPLPTTMLPVVRQLECYDNPQSVLNVGSLVCRRNKFNQLSISFGNYLSVLTPFSSTTITATIPQLQQTNQVLWLNFNNHYTAPFNIVDHLWFEDYLILINRISIFDEDYQDSHHGGIVVASNGKDDIDKSNGVVDEIIVINTTNTRFAIGGEPVVFDTDMIIWRHNFGNWFQSVELIREHDADSGNLVIQSSDDKVIVLELSLNKSHGRSSSSTDLQQEIKDYKIFVGLNRTIHIGSIKSRIALNNVIRLSLIKDTHMLFLLNTGELYFLKHKLAEVGNQNMHEMVKLADCVESFEFTEFLLGDEMVEYLCLRTGEAQVLVYELSHLIDALDKDAMLVLKDKRIVDDVMFYPFRVNERQLSLVGIETASVVKGNYFHMWNNILYQHILYKFVEYELRALRDLSQTYARYRGFPSFDHNLELLLFEYLTDCNKASLLKSLVRLIQLSPSGDSIFINCLRKIEVDYWNTFFEVLETTPHEYMRKLIENENVELCYRYLIVYLNYKKEEGEGESEVELPSDCGTLHANDRAIILSIIAMLDKYHKWEWCFELCRFIKLLDPNDEFFHEIRHQFA